MAQLTIDLAEFDKVRSTITEKESVIKAKELEIIELGKVITGLEKESRVLKITKTVRGYEAQSHRINSNTIQSIIDYVRHYIRNESNYNSGYGFSNRSQNQSQLFERIYHLLEQPYIGGITPSTFQNETKEYINFDDVKAELKTQIELNLGTEYSNLKVQVLNHKIELESLKKLHEEQLKELDEKKDKVIIQLENRLQGCIDNRIEKNKFELYKEEHNKSYKALYEAYERELNKTWLQKLFGK